MTKQSNLGSAYDVLWDVLETIRFRGSIFFHSELSAPWGVAFSALSIPRFHIALSGNLFVGTDTDTPHPLKQGEVIMIPSGTPHWAADQPGRTLVESETVGQACELNSPLFQVGDTTHHLMCGLVRYDENLDHPIFSALPELLHFPEPALEDGVWNTILLIDREIERKKSHSSPVIDRLTEALFIQLLEAYVDNHQHNTGFLAALGEPRLAHALTLIHHNPQMNWTLDDLGKKIGMSKATLNRHFQQMVGIAPMAYIRNWKMIKAKSWVCYSNMTLEKIADKVGFSSAGAMTKAFVRHHQQTPGQIRRGES